MLRIFVTKFLDYFIDYSFGVDVYDLIGAEFFSFIEVKNIRLQPTEILPENKLYREDLIELLRGKEVLIADDRELNLIAMEKNLTSFGMNVTKVRNGYELLKIYKNNLSENGESKFDLILTDISMPLKNGHEVAAEIRSLERENKIDQKHAIPIIAISGDDDQCGVNSAINDYFIKGDEPDYLMQLIAKNLTKSTTH